ncbi:MAG: NYN domain-containing protein [Trueperaceae bacterium]|nr:NYN domain-containing protein [Trueperaceae bacterium]MCO5174469.1 NYN domain-containing protein [Trueperaceae bacterium]MCW5820008.1 NYN domain-containing protein [Trueperaceae bacterium]
MERDNSGRTGRQKEKSEAPQAGQRRPAPAQRPFMPAERVAIFIDGSNLYNGMRENLRNTRVNLAELINQLLRDRPLFRTYYYNAPLTDDYDEELREGQQRFFDSLRRIPYVTVRFGKLHRRPDGSMVEKGIDVAIAVEALSLAYEDAYDTALLVSGDGDYVELVEAVKRRGKHVECAMFRNQSAGTLLEHVDIFQNLDELDWSRIVF